MNIYIVISPSDNGMAEAIGQLYGSAHSHQIVSGTAWAVADKTGSCPEVCEKLGILANGKPGLSGVVVKADLYYGVYDPALWQRIAQWQDSRLRALEVQLTRMDEQLRSITENMAGQKDIKLAVANLKIWILTGVLSAIVICTGIAIAILKVFPDS